MTRPGRRLAGWPCEAVTVAAALASITGAAMGGRAYEWELVTSDACLIAWVLLCGLYRRRLAAGGLL